jgi:cobalt-zinc-cadmium efflux system protein
LNLIFAIFEFIGGFLTNSVAITSDAIHDLGDAMALGASYLLERKSLRKPDDRYTYGYARYSVVSSMLMTVLLMCGSCFVIYNAVGRIIRPEIIDYNGILVFAVVGVAVNLVAAIITKGNGSLNQKAVNLHMIEDIIGWLVVLIGAIIMKIATVFGFTNIIILDPIISIITALYITHGAYRTMKATLEVFLEKTPPNVSTVEIKSSLCLLEGVLDVHHIHVWSIDGQNHCATMHVLVNANHLEIKQAIRHELKNFGITHSTLELESVWESCGDKQCSIEIDQHIHCVCHNTPKT